MLQGADAADRDPCSLLETAEVEAQFGDEGSIVARGQARDACQWDINDQNGDFVAMVQVAVGPVVRGYGSAREAFDEAREELETDEFLGGPTRDVYWLGDHAYITADESILWVLVGETVVNVGGLGISDQEGLEALARLVLDRL